MKFVVDTNILFSFFWKNSVTYKLLLKLEVYSPECALEEIKKYEKEIIKKTGLSKKEFNELRKELVIAVDFIPIEDYKSKLKEALKICPDENDIDFFSLCLKLNLPLWSNDKLLKNQKKIIVLNTYNVLDRIS
ncbi:MAG: PIN domain-containing protein [Candidatus Woesearchaeota archaeon]